MFRSASLAVPCVRHDVGNRWYSSGMQITALSVCKFGDLRVDTSSGCDVLVTPLNPQLYPNQNRASISAAETVRVQCISSDNNSSSHLTVFTDKDLHTVTQPERCIIEVPIKYNVDVLLSGSKSVSVESMQSDSLHVTVASGNCTLSNVQTNCLTVKTGGGNIISEGVQHGDAKLQTHHDGYVHLFKPLCRLLDVSTDRGDITIESLYADESTLVTRSGSVEIRNAHRTLNVSCLNSGNVTIHSLDGNLHAQVKTGHVTAYLCQHNIVDITVQSGDITLKVPVNSLCSAFDLKATCITIDQQLDQSQLSCTETRDCQHISGFVKQATKCMEQMPTAAVATVRAQTNNGCISIVGQDWIGSLKLGGRRFTDSDEE